MIENDDFDTENINKDDSFIIYIGHHGDKIANKANLILPCTAYTEKVGLYLNIEGRPQFTSKVTESIGSAVDSWKIFRALSDALNVKFNFNNHNQLLREISNDYPHLSSLNSLTEAEWKKLPEKKIDIEKEDIDTKVKNFYQTCSISRASSNMASCVKEFLYKK